jgi:hypothetical protein
MWIGDRIFTLPSTKGGGKIKDICDIRFPGCMFYKRGGSQGDGLSSPSDGEEVERMRGFIGEQSMALWVGGVNAVADDIWGSSSKDIRIHMG